MECHSLQLDMEIMPVPAGTHWEDVKQQQLKSDIPAAGVYRCMEWSHGNLELHETELLRVHACIPGDPGSRGANRSGED